ncbi:hypothetical protein RI367_003255 [Sorochytrium milnesiophthora]
MSTTRLSSARREADATVADLTEEELALVGRLGITNRELVELREVFRLVDKDGGGTISKDELELLMQTLGIQASKAELETMVNEISTKDEIDFEEFAVAMSRKVSTSRSYEELIAAFREYDDGGPAHLTGRVSYQSLVSILSEMTESDKPMQREEVEELLAEVAPHALEDGFLDYNKYLGLLFST